MTHTTRDDSIHRADGRRVSWCEIGDPHGWPLVYFHGMPGSRLEAGLFGQAAAERGMRVIAPDRAGYGDTSPSPARVPGDAIGDIEALIDTLELRCFDVLGFSGGGPYALACAVRHTDRVRRAGLISSLAPFDHAGAEGMTDGFRQLWDLAAADFPAFETALEGTVTAAGSAYELLVGSAPAGDRAILQSDAVADRYRACLAEATRQGLTGMFEDARALVSPWSFDVADVRQPTFVWHGADDLNVPVGMGRWLARYLPDARLTEWPQAAHFEAFRRQDEVLDVYTAG